MMDVGTITLVAIPIMSGIAYHLVQNIMTRLNLLENKMKDVIAEPQVRQLISDKLDPIREDLKEIKAQLEKIYDRYVEDAKRNTGPNSGAKG